jgi:hypothetical protein
MRAKFHEEDKTIQHHLQSTTCWTYATMVMIFYFEEDQESTLE